MARVGGDFTESRRGRLEEPRVQAGTIAIGQRQQGMRPRGDGMHVRHVEQLLLTGGEPPLPRLRLTLRTGTVPTRVIGNGFVSPAPPPVDKPPPSRPPPPPH